MKRRFLTIVSVLLAAGISLPAVAAAPSGADTFQLLASPSTGGDNTGDGGTGAPADLNYYYVGQTFTTTMQIKSGGTDAANIWIDHDVTNVTPSSLIDGSYFPFYAGQTTSGGRVKLTGFRTTGTSSGTGTFGTVSWTMVEPSAAAYGTGTPERLDINVGVIGETTESNISLSGADILDDEEDFDFHIWADTVKPYAENPSPASGATNVAVESNFTFDLRDTLNGEGDTSGVGTGVSTAEPPGDITFDDGGGAVSEAGSDSFSCSGTWGTNLCGVSVNPTSPSGIPGDTRNFDYATLYTVEVSGFRDLASASQDQLGDANGPNTMDTKIWTFTTEADTVPPEVTAETPARSSTANSVDTNITIDVLDKKAYPGSISGTGVVSSTCDFNVSSPTFALTTFEQGDAEVSVSAIDYGYRFTINPATDFGVNETVTVSAFNCEDVAGNTMVTDTWTWTTADNLAPYVDQQNPADDDVVEADVNIVFHIKDVGSGVDLSNVVVFVNGVYYTDGGGAGSVTTTGTSITFADSQDLNGGNYAGDTTGVSGTSADYTITIDPQFDFDEGESVPIIVYAKDADGNVMERVVYGLAVEGAAVVVVGGGGGGGGHGGGLTPAIVNEQSVNVIQIDEDSVLVTWTTNVPGSSRVLYDTQAHDSFGGAPNYGYANSTPDQDANSLFHSQIINGLQTGTLYFFRPVSRMRGAPVLGPERPMAPRFAAQTTLVCPEPAPQIVCPKLPEVILPPAVSNDPFFTLPEPVVVPGEPHIIYVPTPSTAPSAPANSEGTRFPFEVINIERMSDKISVTGTARPNSTITFILY